VNTLITLAILIGAPLLGLCLWIWLARSEQGERYMKERMQGPFVPLDSNDKGPGG
jgi:hypothetical protein